jgi:outer membrane protein OmpA-like peptidoglycan-associated protein
MATIAFYLRRGTELAPARRRRLITWTAAAAAIVPVSTLLCGCGPPAGRPVDFVLAASQTANEPQAVLAAPDRASLRQAGTSSSRATALVVSPDTGQARVVPLTPRRADGEVDYGPNRDSELTANLNRVQQLLDQEAATKPFDLLSLIAQAVRVTSHPGTLLVLSSGLSTAGGFDLRQVGWGADPRAAAAALRRRGLLPSLTGWHVVFSGLGDTAGRQPALPLPQRATLIRYWLAICRAAGAASCAVDAVTRPDPPSRSSTPVPVVPVPQVTSFRGPHGHTRTTLPADEFFRFNSATLLPGANAILGPLARQAIARHLAVTITGYASPDGGTAAYNLALSAARARAVEARLIALSVPAHQIVKAAGLGTAGKPRSACIQDGRLDEAVCGLLRRVVITLSPAPAAIP